MLVEGSHVDLLGLVGARIQLLTGDRSGIGALPLGF